MNHPVHHFSEHFCSETIAECLDSITTLTSSNLVCMPGVGVTFLLRALEQKSNHPIIFINSYELPEFSWQALFGQLAQKLELDDQKALSLQAIGEALAKRAQDQERLVIVFNRLDRLGSMVNQNLYDNLRYLRDFSRDKIVMLFVSSEPLLETSAKGTHNIAPLLTRTIYFKGYNDADLNELLIANGMEQIEPRVLELAGGHHTLSQVLLRCQDLTNALADPMVELLVKDMYYQIHWRRRKQLKQLVLRNVQTEDQFLLGCGYVRQLAKDQQVFTPLLAEYIQQRNKQRMPAKEKRLLRILLLHQGKVVSKSDICDFVWPEHNGIVSDWALNALIYRLRHHKAFDAQRYSLESRKKEGYVLYDHLL